MLKTRNKPYTNTLATIKKMNQDLFQKIEILQQILIDSCTGVEGEEDLNGSYEDLRKELIGNDYIADKLPPYVRKNRNLTQFWHNISSSTSTYKERRTIIWDSFSELLTFLEVEDSTPGEISINKKLSSISEGYIEEEWKKALARKNTDPEAAITSSRTLIETVCKHILDELKVEYESKMDLPPLYKLTAKQLNLAPSQHTEQIFKQILNGCQSVVEGLGSLRNKLSDAHGKNKEGVKPNSRHAELAVNLAGTMTLFLFESYENKKNSG